MVPVLTPNKVSDKDADYARAWNAAVDSVPALMPNKVSDKDADYARAWNTAVPVIRNIHQN